MRKTFAMLLVVVMVLSLVACSITPKLQTPDARETSDPSDMTADEYAARLESGVDLDVGEKRLLYTSTYNSHITLDMLEDVHEYQMEFPFVVEEVAYTTDDDRVASVGDTGLITAVGNGTTIVHALVDGMMIHTTVTVENGKVLTAKDPYAAFMLDTFSVEDASAELSRYASITYGMSGVSGIIDNEHYVRTDSFTWDNHYDGCTVKRKLLSTIDHMHDTGYTKLAMEFVASENALNCNFYGVKE